MSIRTLLWTKDQTVLTSSVRRTHGQPVDSLPSPSALDKLVLIAIGDEASEDSWEALIGIEDIAVFVGCTRRAVHESLARLQRAGFLRCRATTVESGRSGWCRIYLLAAESPLVQGEIEVDFGTAEVISRHQMRTYRDRHRSPFVPSDSLRHRQNHPARIPQPRAAPDTEPTEAGEGRVNTVHTPGVNHVRTGGEQGSHSQGEPRSHPSCSTGWASPSDARPRADTAETAETAETPPSESTGHGQDGVDADAGTDGDPVITDEHRAAAAALTARADLSRIGPYPSQVRHIQQALAGALARGYSTGQVRTHFHSKLGEARTVRYLLAGFTPARLADIPPDSGTQTGTLPPVCGQCEARDGDSATLRVLSRENAHGKATSVKCPRCHPHAAAATPPHPTEP